MIRSLCSLVLLVTVGATAGDRSNPRGMGMARTVNATVRQFDALGINPAFLGVPTRAFISVGFVKVGFGLGSDFLGYELYRDYFTGVLDANGGRMPTGRGISSA
jgi:hypothetical protein